MDTSLGKRFTNSTQHPFDSDLFEKLRKLRAKGCLISVGTKGQDNTRTEGRDAVHGSIVGGHAYSMIDMQAPMLTRDRIELVKLRNPW